MVSASFVIVSQRTQLVAYESMSHVYNVVTSSIILVIIGSGISYMASLHYKRVQKPVHRQEKNGTSKTDPFLPYLIFFSSLTQRQ